MYTLFYVSTYPEKGIRAVKTHLDYLYLLGRYLMNSGIFMSLPWIQWTIRVGHLRVQSIKFKSKCCNLNFFLGVIFIKEGKFEREWLISLLIHKIAYQILKFKIIINAYILLSTIGYSRQGLFNRSRKFRASGSWLSYTISEGLTIQCNGKFLHRHRLKLMSSNGQCLTKKLDGSTMFGDEVVKHDQGNNQWWTKFVDSPRMRW